MAKTAARRRHQALIQVSSLGTDRTSRLARGDRPRFQLEARAVTRQREIQIRMQRQRQQKHWQCPDPTRFLHCPRKLTRPQPWDRLQKMECADAQLLDTKGMVSSLPATIEPVFRLGLGRTIWTSGRHSTLSKMNSAKTSRPIARAPSASSSCRACFSCC
ncbi:hypothetical protein BD289DRAFT_268763 [Coniella lustricola]|uniref:Uncharacterized protein n=1 Tax=Coniella lustricola TaxID=2025994 RepID=A0A2T3A6Y6_9PEZI|nr:hypothetical protein BD289DRAFT_268763 [Coniella lustricola]